MNSTDSVFQRAVGRLLKEVFEGSPAEGAFILNPGDLGLLGQLETVDAATASLRPLPNNGFTGFSFTRKSLARPDWRCWLTSGRSVSTQTGPSVANRCTI